MTVKACSTNSNEFALYQQILTLGKRLLAEREVKILLTIAMDAIIDIYGAERGMIILFGNNGEIIFQNARNLKNKDIEHPVFEVSRTIIEKVKTTGDPVCLRNALDDPSLQSSKSVESLKILSVICLPLTSGNEIFGVVYLDNRKVRGVFKDDTCSFVREVTNFISLAAHTALERSELCRRVDVLEEELRGKYEFKSIIGKHPKILEVLKLVSQVANTSATVLIQGESGTGKELIARALHFNSSRKNNAFVPVNCAALPEQLLESELFGHVRGAFTGAIKDRIGWFEKANAGTIFLDEINDMSPALQAKLLRILQTGEYSRVGDPKILKCDVRVVTATSKMLKQLVNEGKFREELYYRLNVIDMILPPLRDRKSDIPLLIKNFLSIYSAQHGKKDLCLIKDVETMLLAYDFPGNIRELENIIQRAVVLAEGETIEIHHLPDGVQNTNFSDVTNTEFSSFKNAKEQAITTFETQYINDGLKATKGNISRAAQIAGIDIKNFHTKMRKYKIDPVKFK